MNEQSFLKKLYFRLFTVEQLIEKTIKERSGPLPAGQKHENVLDERIRLSKAEAKFISDLIDEAIGN